MTHHRTGREETVIVLGVNGSGQAKSLVRTVDYALNALIGEVDDDMQAVFDEVGEQAAQQLRAESEKRGWKKYARGWTYEKQKTLKGKKLSFVRNKTQPQLTHLLEYGHPIFNQYGQTKGTAKAFEHIAPVNDWVQKELVARLEQQLKK